MLITLLTLLLISNALSLRTDKSILFSRVVMVALIHTSFLAYNNLFFLSLDKGIDIFGGLFHVTVFTQVFHIFIFILTAIILTLTSFYPRKVMLNQLYLLTKVVIILSSLTIISWFVGLTHFYPNHLFINKLSFTFFILFNALALRIKLNPKVTSKMVAQYRILEYSLLIVFVLSGVVLIVSLSSKIYILCFISNVFLIFSLKTNFSNSVNTSFKDRINFFFNLNKNDLVNLFLIGFITGLILLFVKFSLFNLFNTINLFIYIYLLLVIYPLANLIRTCVQFVLSLKRKKISSVKLLSLILDQTVSSITIGNIVIYTLLALIFKLFILGFFLFCNHSDYLSLLAENNFKHINKFINITSHSEKATNSIISPVRNQVSFKHSKFLTAYTPTSLGTEAWYSGLSYLKNWQSLNCNLSIIERLNLIPTINTQAMDNLTKSFRYSNYTRYVKIDINNPAFINFLSTPVEYAWGLDPLYYQNNLVTLEYPNSLLLGNDRVSLSYYKKLLYKNNFISRMDHSDNSYVKSIISDHLYQKNGFDLSNKFSLPGPEFNDIILNMYTLYVSYSKEIIILNDAYNFYKGTRINKATNFAFEAWRNRQMFIHLARDNEVSYFKGVLTYNPGNIFQAMPKNVSPYDIYYTYYYSILRPLKLIKDFSLDEQVYYEILENRLFICLELSRIETVIKFLDSNMLFNKVLTDPSLSRTEINCFKAWIARKCESVECSHHTKHSFGYDLLDKYDENNVNYYSNEGLNRLNLIFSR